VLHMTPEGPQTVRCYRPAEPLRAEVAGRSFVLDAVFGPAWEPILGRSDVFDALPPSRSTRRPAT
jgi:hypothetical protein